MDNKLQITGAQLRNWRTSQHITQCNAADLLGVALITYKKWESGKRIDKHIPQPISILIGLLDMEES